MEDPAGAGGAAAPNPAVGAAPKPVVGAGALVGGLPGWPNTAAVVEVTAATGVAAAGVRVGAVAGVPVLITVERLGRPRVVPS